MQYLTELIGNTANFMFTYIIIALLLGAGLFFTFITKGAQFKLFGDMFRVLFSSRKGSGGGISSFQAFAIGIASRVGTGNIVGVATALIVGGAGAIFWMWMVAVLGMATAIVEATLAQVYKHKVTDSKGRPSFRGGPAWYMKEGLNMGPVGSIFAFFVILAFGVAFEMIQANTIAQVFKDTFAIDTYTSAFILLILCSPLILGGLRTVARATEVLAPIMALAYVGVALVILVLHIDQVPALLGSIFAAAFEITAVGGGLSGAFVAAILNGVKRGLFSNEAGMGSAPNAAATATVAHPMQQGLIQSFGVFLDTIVVCTATAIMIMVSTDWVDAQALAKADIEAARELAPTLTQQAVASSLGDWMLAPMAVMIFIFAYSSILGNFVYAEVNGEYLGLGSTAGLYFLRVLTLASVLIGAVSKVAFVWNLGDFAQAFMSVFNLIAILLLFKVFLHAYNSYMSQRDKVKAGDFDSLTYTAPTEGDLHVHVPQDIWKDS